MPDVFLSYARADDDPNYDDAEKSFMRRLYNALTAEGFNVWWDREKLPARSLSFTEEIETAIRTCARFVLVAGAKAKTSDYVTAEWTFALAQCKPITPALREGDNDYANIPAELRDINAIDCRPERDEAAAFRDLINRLREAAPLGDKIGVKDLPRGYVNRPAPYNAAYDALMADAIQTTVTVISTPGRDVKPQSAIAVYGLGGIGKSTLATALADDCDIRRHFRDGVIWLEVGQTPIVTSLQASVGVHFGDVRENYQDERDGALSLSRALRDKAALLVLDDVWDHKIVERFPVSGTACRLLITTRSGALAGRVQGADVRLDLLSPDEGAAIIAGRTGADDPVYRQISETLGGHTLAVTLAAHQIAEGYADNAADLLRLLEKRASGIEPFKDLAVDEDDKDLNLALSLSLSYDALKDDDLRRRFRATGIFALEGSFDRAALAAVWGDADQDDARKPIQVLVGVGLLDALPLSEAERGAGGEVSHRYSQHRLLHAYGRALLHDPKEAEAGEADAIFERYADFYTAKASAIFRLQPEGWSQHDADLPDITALGDALMERTENGTPDNVVSAATLARAMAFAASTTRYVARRRETHKWPWLEMGLDAVRVLRAESPDDETLMRRESLFLNELALAWSALGEKRKALDYYEQALPVFRAVGDRGGEAGALTNIGSAWHALGEKRKALDYYQQALPVFRAVGDRGGEATTLNNIGMTYRQLGELQKALDYYEQVLPVFRAVGSRGGEATTLNNIGMVWDELGEKRKALDYYEQALPLRRAVGDRGGEAVTCFNIGMIYHSLGDLDKAIEYVERCVQLDIEVEHPDLESDRRALEQLKRERDGGGVPQSDSPQNTLPAEMVNTLAGNTVAVMTNVSNRREEWREALQKARNDMAGTNANNEIAFADALLAIMDGETPTLAEGNPYAEVVWRVAQSIEAYHLAAHGTVEVDKPKINAEDIQTALMAQLAPLYRQGGAAAVRSMLAGIGVPQETIEAMLRELESME